ncbi:MAG: hypothetical protein U1C73_13965 [Dietzia sp.]|nr:hypothetical protein [Dietzia sp.]
MTTIRTENFRRIEADTTGFEVTCTASNTTLEVALTPDERRTLADALTADQGGQWTAADFPDEGEFADLVRKALSGAIRESGKDLLPGTRLRAIRDLLAQWMNAHHPKPDPGAMSENYTPEGVDIVMRNLADSRRDRDAADERAEQAEQLIPAYAMLDVWGALGRDSIHFDDWYDERGYADAWAELAAAVREAAETHDDPAVYVVRESDIAAVEVNEYENGGWEGRSNGKEGLMFEPFTCTPDGLRAQSEDIRVRIAIREAIARAIEAEQAVDPIEAKAIELHQVAYGGRIGFGHATLNAQEMFRILARHVLGQEADHA